MPPCHRPLRSRRVHPLDVMERLGHQRGALEPRACHRHTSPKNRPLPQRPPSHHAMMKHPTATLPSLAELMPRAPPAQHHQSQHPSGTRNSHAARVALVVVTPLRPPAHEAQDSRLHLRVRRAALPTTSGTPPHRRALEAPPRAATRLPPRRPSHVPAAFAAWISAAQFPALTPNRHALRPLDRDDVARVSRHPLREFLVRDVAASPNAIPAPSTSITEMRANAVAVEPGSRPVTQKGRRRGRCGGSRDREMGDWSWALLTAASFRAS